MNLSLEKDILEKIVNYLGSKPWLEVQHLIVPLIQAIKAVEAEVVADVEKVIEKK